MKKNAFSRVIALLLALIMVVGNAAVLVVAAEEHVHTEECNHSCPGKAEDHTLVTCPDGEKIKTVAPGCETWGYTLYQCPVCDAYFADDFVVANGTCQNEVTKEPTCTEAGEKTCSVCEAVTPIPATGHDFGAWTTVKNETGCKKARTCATCSFVEEDGSDEAHTWNKVPTILVKPTHTENGLAEYTCEVCGDTKQVVIISDHQHDVETIPAVAPTCTEDGNFEYVYCETCDKYWIGNEEVTLADTVDKAKGHDYEHGIIQEHVDSSCTEKGHNKIQCANCDAVETFELPLAPHTPIVSQYTAPTCTRYGLEIYTCSVCGAFDKDEDVHTLPPTGHTTLEQIIALDKEGKGDLVYVAPTCTKNGSYSWTCQNPDCTAAFNVTIDPTGCDVVEVNVPATCAQYAYSYKYCTHNCDKADGRAYATVATHPEHGDFVVAINGAAVWYVENSLVVYKDLGLNKDNHDAQYRTEVGVNLPTCTEPGNSVYFCTHCSAKFVKFAIPALGHEFDLDKSEKQKLSSQTCTTDEIYRVKCTRCDETKDITNEEAYGHDWTGDVIKVKATCVIAACEYTVCKNGCGEVKVLVEGTTLEYRAIYSLAEAKEAHENLEYRDVYRHGTCTIVGLYKYYCFDCDKAVLVEMEGTGKHALYVSKTAKAPTCLEAGWTAEESCSRCNIVVTASKDLEALGHDIISDATCGKGSVCSRCGEQDDALTHNHELIDSRDADCINYGWEHYVCSNCGDEYIVEYYDEAGHTEEKVDGVEPTCTTTGLTDGKVCSVCGEVLLAQDVIPAKGHHNKAGDELVDTCLNADVEDRKCVDCELEIGTSHNMTAPVAFPANCITPAYTLSVCVDCEYEEKIKVGEDFGDHNYERTSYVAPTYHTTGLATYVCTFCKDVKEDVIPTIDGVGYYVSVENADIEGAIITDRSLIAVTVALDGDNVDLWGFKFNLNYDNTILAFEKAEFVCDDFNTLAKVSDNGTFVTVAANTFNAEDGTVRNATIGEMTNVVVLYFRVNYVGNLEDVPLTIDSIDTVEAKGETSVDVVSVAYNTTFDIEMFLDVNKDGEFNIHDMYVIYNIITGESSIEYTALVDLDRDGEITMVDYLAIFDHYIGSVTYEQLVGRAPMDAE